MVLAQALSLLLQKTTQFAQVHIVDRAGQQQQQFSQLLLQLRRVKKLVLHSRFLFSITLKAVASNHLFPRKPCGMKETNIFLTEDYV